MLRKWLQNLLRPQAPEPKVYFVVRHSEPIEWTVADADFIRSIMDSDSWRKMLAFEQDAIFNDAMAGVPREVLKGKAMQLAALKAYAGLLPEDREELFHGEQPTDDQRKELSTVQFAE